MKIKENSLINVIQNEKYIKHHVTNLLKLIMVDGKRENAYRNKMNLLNETNYRKLVFSNKSLENLVHYNVPKDIRVDVLKSLPNRKDIIQLDERTCIQYQKTDEFLCVMFHYTKVNDTLIYMNYFEVNLVTKKIRTDDKTCYFSHTTEMMNIDKLIEYFYSKFLVVITYLELTEVTLNVLQSGASFGTRKSGKIKNDTKKRYILVNSNWNVTTIRLDEFSVRGHFRLQPCGVGRKQYKYIFIEPFTKGGLKRLAQKKAKTDKILIS